MGIDKGKTPLANDTWGGDLMLEEAKFNRTHASGMQLRTHNITLALRGVPDKDVKELFKLWFTKALAGDADAAKLVFPHVFGKPDIGIDVKADVKHTHRNIADMLSPEQRRVIAQRMLNEISETESEREPSGGSPSG